jgi:cytoskeletal protein CcmA (bactofilin family)
MRTYGSSTFSTRRRGTRHGTAGFLAFLAVAGSFFGPPAASQEISASAAIATALESALASAFPQERTAEAGPRYAEIVSKQIAVASDEASLRLELADGNEVEIRFEDRRVHLDGEDLGSVDDDAERIWRELLGRAVALDDGPLARALVEWQPPQSSDDGVLERIDDALERALERPAVTGLDAPGGELAALSRLLTRTEHLGALAAALDDLDVDGISIRIGEDVVIGEGEELDATLLVIDGDVDVEGRVRGHVVVVSGRLRTFEGATIDGDVRLADARLVRNGGVIEGLVREFDDASLEARIEERVRDAEQRLQDAEERTRRAQREVMAHAESRGEHGLLSPFRSLSRSIGQGIAGLMETLAALVVLSLFGGLMVLFGRQNLEVVAETARRSPGRSAMVGVAGAFLTFPVWLLGAVALAISIIGIPVAIAWLPLFPLAVAAAAALGYFAVAHNTGEWLARRRYPYLDWVRTSNAYTLVVGGVLGLLAAFFMAHVVSLFGPWLGFLKGLLITAGVVITTGAALIGFGAVLLTRAGRRPGYYGAGGGDYYDDDGWSWESPSSPGPKSGPDASGAAESTEASGGTDDEGQGDA